MSTKKKMLWLLSLLPFFIACGDDNTDIPDWPWAEPETPTEPVEANPDIVNLGWTNVKSTYGTLPEHINVYKSPETLEGKKAWKNSGTRLSVRGKTVRYFACKMWQRWNWVR